MIELQNLASKLDNMLELKDPTISYKIIENLKVAYDYATDQCMVGKEDWTDLRKNLSAETIEAAYQIDGGSDLLDKIYSSWEELEFNFPEGFALVGADNDLEADFLLIAQS